MLKTCLFDLGNVLVKFSHDRMCEQIGALCARTGPAIRSTLIDSGLQWNFERGLISEADYHQQLSMLLETPFEVEELWHAGSDIFHVNEPALAIVDRLKSMGMRLVLLSNISAAHHRWIDREYDILDRFDDLTLSYQAGAIKPETPIYEAALKKIQCQPDECFYTDDIAEYVETGRTYGLHAEVFTTPEILREHLRRHDVEV